MTSLGLGGGGLLPAMGSPSAAPFSPAGPPTLPSPTPPHPRGWPLTFRGLLLHVSPCEVAMHQGRLPAGQVTHNPLREKGELEDNPFPQPETPPPQRRPGKGEAPECPKTEGPLRLRWLQCSGHGGTPRLTSPCQASAGQAHPIGGLGAQGAFLPHPTPKWHSPHPNPKICASHLCPPPPEAGQFLLPGFGYGDCVDPAGPTSGTLRPAAPLPSLLSTVPGGEVS